MNEINTITQREIEQWAQSDKQTNAAEPKTAVPKIATQTPLQLQLKHTREAP